MVHDPGPIDPVQREQKLQQLYQLALKTGEELEYDDPMLPHIESLQGHLLHAIWPNLRGPEDLNN